MIMKSFLMFVFLLVWNLESNSQELRLNFKQAKSIDEYGEVLIDWHPEQNTIIINAYGGTDIVWIKADGTSMTFSFYSKTTAYDTDGYYHELYVATYWDSYLEATDYVDIRWYADTNLLVIDFWYGSEGFQP
jgi:hypothetical protein